jgi:hypothetical protein
VTLRIAIIRVFSKDNFLRAVCQNISQFNRN